MPLENLEGHEYLLGTAFWFPISKEHNDNRIKILECALEDLERILRCSEGNRVWYRLWINPEDMERIEPLLEIEFGWKNLRCIILSSMR